MIVNTSGVWDESQANSSLQCGHNMTSWDQRMDKMYTYFYLLLFIPGLLLNTTALWVLCRHISKKTKAVIFMINLALADLAHILSLPLRIYYYFTHTWPFGRSVCLFCFYLKYLNMYAAIVFLVCISMQRCVFLLNPFSARRWRRRYDLLISVVVWVVVGLACSPFILMRSSSSSTSTTSPGVSTQTVYNMSYPLEATPTQHPLGYITSPSSLSPSSSIHSSSKDTCFRHLPMRRLRLSVAVTMMAFGELFGFLIPLACISFSSIRIARSLIQRQTQDQSNTDDLNLSARSRLQSVTSNSQTDKYHEKQMHAEKRRALRMVLSCFALFLICFAPYHLNFLLYLMVSQDIVYDCATRLAVHQFHPMSLCLASLSCCLNPLLYYFLTAEFRQHLTRRTSSFTTSLLSSPISSPRERPAPGRLMSMESSCSGKDYQYSEAK
ncbi:putative P2Y purinoceptor 10 [Sander vitreus]